MARSFSLYGMGYYDPRTSVWQSPDPILESYMSGQTNGGVFNPKNLSLFTYTYNNPVNFIDPDGEATIMIDPGHGDHHSSNSQVDPGAVSGGLKEKDLALSFSKAVGQQLQNKGHTVLYTRTGDVVDKSMTKLKWRTDKGNAKKADLFVSIHLDAASPKAKGITVFANKKASNMKSTLESSLTGRKIRSAPKRNLSVLRRSKGAAMLIEAGFITNPSDVKQIQEKGDGSLANQMASGLDNAVKQQEKK